MVRIEHLMIEINRGRKREIELKKKCSWICESVPGTLDGLRFDVDDDHDKHRYILNTIEKSIKTGICYL